MLFWAIEALVLWFLVRLLVPAPITIPAAITIYLLADSFLSPVRRLGVGDFDLYLITAGSLGMPSWPAVMPERRSEFW